MKKDGVFPSEKEPSFLDPKQCTASWFQGIGGMSSRLTQRPHGQPRGRRWCACSRGPSGKRRGAWRREGWFSVREEKREPKSAYVVHRLQSFWCCWRAGEKGSLSERPPLPRAAGMPSMFAPRSSEGQREQDSIARRLLSSSARRNRRPGTMQRSSRR